MDITKFNEKFNKIDGNIYTVEEVVTPVNGVYEAELSHDNVNLKALNVYTGSKLTGDKINTYVTSTPSLTPWKTVIKIFSDVSQLYISYETTGDTVEADDINNVQEAIADTQKNLNIEVDRATNVENTLANNLNAEALRAKISENALNNIISTNKPNWDDKYSKNEVDNKISAVVTNLDYKEHVANFSDIATTYPNAQDGWTVSVDKDNVTYKYNGSTWIPISANSIPLSSSTVDGKMSKQDKIDHDDMNSKKHTHPNKSILDIITQNLVNAWNAAYIHISDTVKHITSDERTLWNTVSNKVDNITGKSLSTNDFDNNYKSKVDGITPNSNKVEVSSINGNIKIDGVEKTVYTHPSGSNPHGTTKSDIGLGNVTNDIQVKRSEMGAVNGVATLNSLGVNNQDPKPHIHDDRYYTESESDAKYATKDQVSKAGYGDMLKSTYDTNNDGIVDNSDKLGGKHASDFQANMNLGSKTSGDKPSTWPNGIYYNTVYNNGYPSNYGTLLTIKGTTGASATQIFQSWPGDDGGESYIWIRACRDCGTDVWGQWRKIWSENNLNPNNYMSKGPLTWNDLEGI